MLTLNTGWGIVNVFVGRGNPINLNSKGGWL